MVLINSLDFPELLDNMPDDKNMSEAKDDRFPRLGAFYFYQNKIITSEEYQRRINPMTYEIEKISDISFSPKEHRDMWDKYMLVKYPELKVNYDDNHKNLPRGRVDYKIENGKLSFYVTLDICIENCEAEIKWIFNLAPVYEVEFHYGSMNYHCRDCRNSQTK